MLVLVALPNSGAEELLSGLVSRTGMVAYDLRTRLRAGQWGVLRAVASQKAATTLLESVRRVVARSCAVPSEVGSDPNRRIVVVEELELRPHELTLLVGGQKMVVPTSALLVLVRGDLKEEDELTRGMGPPPSSGSLRTVVRTPERHSHEMHHGNVVEALPVLDLHFITVPWVARIEVRHTNLSRLGFSLHRATALDELAALLTKGTTVQVDHGARHGTLWSQATLLAEAIHEPQGATSTSVPASARSVTDLRFDVYSRLVGEAERLVFDWGAVRETVSG